MKYCKILLYFVIVKFVVDKIFELIKDLLFNSFLVKRKVVCLVLLNNCEINVFLNLGLCCYLKVVILVRLINILLFVERLFLL